MTQAAWIDGETLLKMSEKIVERAFPAGNVHYPDVIVKQHDRIATGKIKAQVFRDAKFTTVVVKHGDTTVGVGTSACSPLDMYSSIIGTNIALSRAFRSMWRDIAQDISDQVF